MEKHIPNDKSIYSITKVPLQNNCFSMQKIILKNESFPKDLLTGYILFQISLFS